MNKLYLIQFRETTKDNSILIDRIKSLGSWVNYFNDNWIVQSNLTAKQIYEQLSIGYAESSFFIIELSKTNSWGRMETKIWDWLKSSP